MRDYDFRAADAAKRTYRALRDEENCIARCIARALDRRGPVDASSHLGEYRALAERAEIARAIWYQELSEAGIGPRRSVFDALRGVPEVLE